MRITTGFTRPATPVREPELGTSMISPPHALYLNQYRLASGEGAVVELKLRMLVDKNPQLQEFSHAQKLEDIEYKISRHFGEVLSQDEKSALAYCRQLRNKILHCDFGGAREKLAALGAEPQHGRVKTVNVSGLSAAQMVAKTKSAIAGQPGTFEYVAMSPTKSPGSVFGWLLEMGASGDFLRAAQVFRDAAAIVDRLANLGTPPPGRG